MLINPDLNNNVVHTDLDTSHYFRVYICKNKSYDIYTHIVKKKCTRLISSQQNIQYYICYMYNYMHVKYTHVLVPKKDIL